MTSLDRTSSPAAVRRPMRGPAVLVTAVGVMLVNSLAGTLPGYLLLRWLIGDGVLPHLVACAGATGAALLTCWSWHRWTGHAEGRGVFAGSGLPVTRATAWVFGLGAGLAAAVVGLVATAATLLGAGGLRAPELDGNPVLAVLDLLAVAWLLQGFPEELVWRSQAARELSRTWSPRAVIIGTSVAFGAVHVLSRSGATNAGERAAVVLAATAFGFALVCCRTTGRGLWLGVGFHGGYDLVWADVRLEPGYLGPMLLLDTLLLVALGLLLLRLAGPGRSGVARCAGPQRFTGSRGAGR